MAEDKIEISVIIPAFNEAARLPLYLEEVVAYLSSSYPGSHEILVVDDGGTDGTADIVRKRLGEAALIRLPRNRGKGAAVRAGMLQARGALRLFADADGSTPIAEERRLSAAIRAGFDVAAGSRAAEGGVRRWELMSGKKEEPATDSPVWHVRPHRHLLGRVFSAVVKTMLALPIQDTQCGFKMFRDSAAVRVFSMSRLDRFAFDVEVLHLARRLGYRITEVPVSWHEMPGSKVRLSVDPWRMFLEVMAIRNLHRNVTAAAPVTQPVTQDDKKKAG